MKRFKRTDNLAFQILLDMIDHIGTTQILKLLQIAIAYDLRMSTDTQVKTNRLLDTLNESIIASEEAYQGLGKAISSIEDYQSKIRSKK